MLQPITNVILPNFIDDKAPPVPFFREERVVHMTIEVSFDSDLKQEKNSISASLRKTSELMITSVVVEV